jgi:hypothetical protein
MIHDKPPVTTFVHRESTFTIFSVEKNLSKTLIANSMEDYIKNEAMVLMMNIPSIKVLTNILKLKSIILLIIHKNSMIEIRVMLIIEKIDIRF